MFRNAISLKHFLKLGIESQKYLNAICPLGNYDWADTKANEIFRLKENNANNYWVRNAQIPKIAEEWSFTDPMAQSEHADYNIHFGTIFTYIYSSWAWYLTDTRDEITTPHACCSPLMGLLKENEALENEQWKTLAVNWFTPGILLRRKAHSPPPN